MAAIELASLAKRVHGELFARQRNTVVTGAAPLSDAKPGHITLIDDEKNLERLQQSQATAVVTPKSFEAVELAQIVVPNPHDAFARICELFRPNLAIQRAFGVDPRANVSVHASVSPQSFVEAFACIDDESVVGEGTHIHRSVTIMRGCTIGKNCQLYPGVVLYPGTILGDNVVLHAGVVLGAHGFGYRLVDGQHQPTAQLGWVEIENDVEIGSNTAIDRGTYGATRIGQGTKIDNLVMIGHNCNIGKYNLICGQVGIAGSTSTGDYVVLAGQVGIRDHVHVGNRAMIGAQSGVTSNVAPDQVMLGSPALPRRDQAILYASTNRLPEIRKTLRKLEVEVEQLIKKS